MDASEPSTDPKSPLSPTTDGGVATAEGMSFDPVIEGLRGQQQSAGALPPNGDTRALGELAASALSLLSGLEPPPPSGPRFVTEYVRKGSRLVPVKVLVRGLTDLVTESETEGPAYDATGMSPLSTIDFTTPVQLHNVDTRLSSCAPYTRTPH